MITRHSRVRLSDNAARMAMRGYSGLRRKRTCDWTTREGTVISVGRTGTVTMIWDGNTSYDHWPMRALQRVTQP